MTNSLAIIPGEILGDEIFSKLKNSDDVMVCARVSKGWHETIQTNAVAIRLIKNIFPDAFEKCPEDNYYETFCALHKSQLPVKLEIRSQEIDDLNLLANHFEQMQELATTDDDYRKRISPILDRLPPRIQKKLYDQISIIAQKLLNFDCPDEPVSPDTHWGKAILHSSNTRRHLPSYRMRKEAVQDPDIILQEKQFVLANTFIKGTGRDQEKAIQQFSQQIPQETKNEIYQKFQEILTRHNLFHHESGKEAFYAGDIPNFHRGRTMLICLSGRGYT